MYRAGRARTRTPKYAARSLAPCHPPNTSNTHGAAGVARQSFARAWTLSCSSSPEWPRNLTHSHGSQPLSSQSPPASQPARAHTLGQRSNAGRMSRSENPAASSLAGPTLAARGWHPTHEASAGRGRLAADWTLAGEGKSGWGAARLNTLYTVELRGVALRGRHDAGGECSVVPSE